MVSDDRPSRSQRDQARQAIRAAFATGRIVEVDHDQRLAAVDNAQTTTELAMVTQGLEPAVPGSWSGYQAPGTASSAGTEPSAPLPHVPYGSPSGSGAVPPLSQVSFSTGTVTTGASWKVGIVIAFVVLVIIGGAGVAVVSAVGGLSDIWDDSNDGASVTDTQLAPGAMHEDGSLGDLAAALRDAKGDSLVYDAVLYPDYAVVTATVENGSARSQSYYWNGQLQAQTKSTSQARPFDLADIDDTMFDELCDKAEKELAGGASPCYIIIRRPAAYDNGAWFWVYASNEYGEGGYFTVDRNGKEIDRYVS